MARKNVRHSIFGRHHKCTNKHKQRLFWLLTGIFAVGFLVLSGNVEHLVAIFLKEGETDAATHSVSAHVSLQLSNALSTYTTLALAAALLLSVLYLIFKNRRSLIAHSRMRRLQRGSRTIDVGDFLCQLDTLVHNGDFSGIYVLYNVDKDAYYVGQAHRVLARVKQHFSGHGNGDVYADWKYGDTFTLTMFDLYHSGYMSLDDFERDAIAYYGAYTHGYNKNHGIQRTQR